MRTFVAGHRGMVGSALVREAERQRRDVLLRGREQLDLTDQRAVFEFFSAESPDAVIVAAARVGGIHANDTYPADFIYDNLVIAANVVQGAFQAGVKRLLFLGSSCIYPKHAPQPMKESCLLEGALEPTNEAYAIAKIAGLKLCQYYRKQHGVLYHSAMPTNLYGPGDNYHPENSHVIPGLIRRFHAAKESGDAKTTLWGSGTPRREFLHVDDLARACFCLIDADDPADWVNVGTGTDVSILELATAIADVVGFEGEIVTDPSKPDGTPRKCMDVSLMKSLGWTPKIELQEGLRDTYQCYLEEIAQGRVRTGEDSK